MNSLINKCSLGVVVVLLLIVVIYFAFTTTSCVDIPTDTHVHVGFKNNWSLGGSTTPKILNDESSTINISKYNLPHEEQFYPNIVDGDMLLARNLIGKRSAHASGSLMPGRSHGGFDLNANKVPKDRLSSVEVEMKTPPKYELAANDLPMFLENYAESTTVYPVNRPLVNDKYRIQASTPHNTVFESNHADAYNDVKANELALKNSQAMVSANVAPGWTWLAMNKWRKQSDKPSIAPHNKRMRKYYSDLPTKEPFIYKKYHMGNFQNAAENFPGDGWNRTDIRGVVPPSFGLPMMANYGYQNLATGPRIKAIATRAIISEDEKEKYIPYK
jgi:hypothetical protein